MHKPAVLRYGSCKVPSIFFSTIWYGPNHFDSKLLRILMLNQQHPLAFDYVVWHWECHHLGGGIWRLWRGQCSCTYHPLYISADMPTQNPSGNNQSSSLRHTWRLWICVHQSETKRGGFIDSDVQVARVGIYSVSRLSRFLLLFYLVYQRFPFVLNFCVH